MYNRLWPKGFQGWVFSCSSSLKLRFYFCKMKKILALLFFCPLLVTAQFEVAPSNELPVFRENGSIVTNPWTGGLNAAQLSMMDADMDGDEDDIFIFDKAGDRILIFIGRIEGGERIYEYNPRLAQYFPPLTDWALLRDFDCDGKRDIFTYSPIGGAVAVYRNTSTVASGLSFELYDESVSSYYDFGTSDFTTNIYVSSQDIPAIFDFEGDGDLDFLVFSVGGSSVELHLNESVEETGNCGIDNIVLRNRCYGRFIEGSENNGIIQEPELVNQFCNFNVVNPKRGDNRDPRLQNGGARHIGSTILAFDATQDGMPEIILGDVTYTNMTYLENNDRGDMVDSMGYVSSSFPTDFGTAAVHLDNFPAGYYEDVTGDNINDLVVGVNNPYSSSNKESVWFYENLGENDLPIFNLVQQNFLQDQTIDFGEASAPTFFDYNNDGLMDLVIGTRGEYLGAGTFYPSLSLYLNEGTLNEPSFRLINEDWLSVSSLDIGQFPHPTFGDIDGDGDFDLMVGESSGVVHFFENTAASGQDASLELVGNIIADASPIDVGQSSTPTLYDLSGDGLLDLIVPERNGNINYFKNIGTETDYEFTLITEMLGGIEGTQQGFFIGNTGVQFYEYNGETFLAVGYEGGTITTYNNIDNNQEGTYNIYQEVAFGIDVGMRAKPCIIDINGDNLMDIFVGSVGGGVSHFDGNLSVGFGDTKQVLDNLVIFPNPTSGTLQIQTTDGTLLNSASTSIYSISGQLVWQETVSNNAIDVSALPPGMYIIEINTDDAVSRTKFVKK